MVDAWRSLLAGSRRGAEPPFPLVCQCTTEYLSPIPNCLLTDAMGGAMDCATFNAPPDFNDQNTCPDLSCLWTSEFHSMRGLLITPAAANGIGPQVLTTTAGDQLLLQARVYNYSLMDIPADVTVHVRFDSQEWDHASNTPIGESVLIDEVTLEGGDNPTICGFRSSAPSCASDNEPNWQMVSTTFDTTDFAEQYLTFWTVVWMEGANGSLVKELDGHGLSELPGTLASIAQVPLEMVSALECQLTGSSNLDCHANTSKTRTSFSNNAGFYKQALFVFAPQNTPEKVVPLAADKRDASLVVENITVSPPQAMINEKVEVSALLSTSDEPADGVLATFYDGDPIANGRAFEAELVPYIRANDVFQIRVPFCARTCGTHELFVVVGEGTDAPAQTKATLEVTCQPLAVTKLVGKAYRVGSGRANASIGISGKFSFPGKLNFGKATLTLTSLLNEEGTELVRGADGEQLLPLTLTRNRKGKGHSVIFKTSPHKKGSKKVGVRVRLSTRNGRLKLNLRVRRAVIETPQLCRGTPATTAWEMRFRVDDGNNEPVEIKTMQEWQCRTDRKGTIRRLRLPRFVTPVSPAGPTLSTHQH